MARRIITSSESKSTFKFMYVVDTAVGQGGDNKRLADNQLVQLFLRHFYNLNPALFKKLQQPPPPRRQAIALDGQVGGQTISGISVFQQDTINNGFSAVFVDGRVSVPVGFRVANTNHVFTIFQLNSFFFNTNAENLSFNGNMEDHPVVKASLPHLRKELDEQRVREDLLK